MRKYQARQGVRGLALAIAACAWTNAALAVPQNPVVDGSLADWGITVKDGSASVTRYFNTGSINQCGTDNSSSGCAAGAVGIQYNTNATGTVYNAGTNATVGFQKQDGIEGPTSGAPVFTVNAAKRNEDIFDGSNSQDVDPNRGGQNYDAEWMGTALVGNTLYLGILSGVRPDNGFDKFGVGDVRLVAKNAQGQVIAEFGIEVGGGKGGVSGDTAAGVGGTSVANSIGSTYLLDGSGNTTGVVLAENSTSYATSSGTGTLGSNAYKLNTGQTAGTIWKTKGSGISADNCGTAGDYGAWLCDPIDGITADGGISNGELDGKTPNQIGYGATLVGEAASFIYTRNQSVNGTSSHSVIEVAFDLSLLGNFVDLDIYWGPACGNDILEINWPRPQVPAPGGLVLLGSALAAFAALRRRQRTAKP